MMPTELDPFGHAAQLYRAAGWRGTLPLPYGRKTPPPDGFTGAAGAWPSEADVHAWIEDDRPRNIALRLPPGVIGLDIDAYDGRPGAETLAALERKLGRLPPTWRSSSRDDDPHSGIRFYRVPEGVTGMWAGPGIDVIRYAHRYAVVWPSVHPSGRVYRWYRPDGTVAAPGEMFRPS